MRFELRTAFVPEPRENFDMAEIVQFPSRVGLEWKAMAQIIRDHIRAVGASEQMADWVISDMKTRLQGIDWNVEANIPAAAEAGVNEIVKQFREIINHLLFRFSVLEVNLYNELFASK